MSIDISPLNSASRLLFTVPLRPVQGDRFQPTGFPSLGAATYQTLAGTKLLVESAQSMANRLETTCWDVSVNEPVAALKGISHVRITHKGKFLTDTMLEAHRLNSPYLLESKKDRSFFDALKADLGGLESGPVDRKVLARVLLKYDVGSLLHGVFLAKKDLAGGRLRVARVVSAFIEAGGVRVAASGGVKNDHIHPGKVEGDTKNHFGNIPFARDEFTAENIDCHINIDLGQIRGYGLGAAAEHLLILLALYRIRRLLDGDLRLRTACDLEPVNREAILATRPAGFSLPSLEALEGELPASITACAALMTSSTFAFEDDLRSAKEGSAKKDKESDTLGVDVEDESDEQA